MSAVSYFPSDPTYRLVALIAHVYGIITSGHERRRGAMDDLLEEDLRDPINSVFSFLRVKIRVQLLERG